jgi:hypothetical protein
MLTDFRNEIKNMFAEVSNYLNPTSSVESNIETNSRPKFTTWCWGGMFHMIPEDFRFPITMNVKTLWDLWHYGNLERQIRPYKLIRGKNDLVEKVDCAAFSKARLVMEKIEEIAISLRLVGIHNETADISNLDKLECDLIFEKAFPSLLQQIRKVEPKRAGEYSYITVYDMIKSQTKKQKVDKS